MGVLDRLRKRRDKLQRKVEEAALKQHGGIQTCPWCKQCAQSKDGWYFRPSEETEGLESGLEVLHCGVCGGTSLWLWAMGMIFMRALDPPPVAEPRLPPPGDPQ